MKSRELTTVSVTNGVGVQPRGGLPFDSDGTELVKLRDRAGRTEERGKKRHSRCNDRLGFILRRLSTDRQIFVTIEERMEAKTTVLRSHLSRRSAAKHRSLNSMKAV